MKSAFTFGRPLPPDTLHIWFQSAPTVHGPRCLSTTTVGPMPHCRRIGVLTEKYASPSFWMRQNLSIHLQASRPISDWRPLRHMLIRLTAKTVGSTRVFEGAAAPETAAIHGDSPSKTRVLPTETR